MILPPLYHDRATAVRLPLTEGQTPPPEPVSLFEVCEELRITDQTELRRIETLMISARGWLEQRYRLALVPGTHQCVVPATADGRLDLPVHPVRTVTQVARRGAAGVDTPVADGQWWSDLRYQPARVWVGRPGLYVVTCQTGWSPTEIPGAMKEAITYRVWGYLDNVAETDWLRVVARAVGPYTVRGL